MFPGLNRIRPLLLIPLFVVLVVPLGSGQDAADLRLWLSQEHPIVNDQDANCLNEAFTYPLAPASPPTGSAVLGGSAGAAPCTTQFVLNVTAPFVIQGALRVHVLLKCDPGSVAAGPTAGLPTLRLVLLHNDKSLLNNSTAVPADTCANGETKTYEAGAVVENRTAIEVRDQLVLRIISAWVNPPSATGKGLAVVTGASGSYVDLPAPAAATPPSSNPAPSSSSSAASSPSPGPASSSTSSSSTATDGSGGPLTDAPPKKASAVPGLLVAAAVVAVAASLRRFGPQK